MGRAGQGGECPAGAVGSHSKGVKGKSLEKCVSNPRAADGFTESDVFCTTIRAAWLSQELVCYLSFISFWHKAFDKRHRSLRVFCFVLFCFESVCHPLKPSISPRQSSFSYTFPSFLLYLPVERRPCSEAVLDAMVAEGESFIIGNVDKAFQTSVCGWREGGSDPHSAALCWIPRVT